jgi:hypothetical protein
VKVVVKGNRWRERHVFHDGAPNVSVGKMTTTTTTTEEGEIQQRRAEELEALRAYYGDDHIFAIVRNTSSSSGSVDVGVQPPPPAPPSTSIDGWFLRLRRIRRRRDCDRGALRIVDVENSNDGANATNAAAAAAADEDAGWRIMGRDPALELRLSSSYPLGDMPPMPTLHNVMMEPNSMSDLLNGLRDAYECGYDVGMIWGDACICALENGDMTCPFDNRCEEEDRGRGSEYCTRREDGTCDDSTSGTMTTDRTGTIDDDDHGGDDRGRTRTFVPPNGTRYGQSIRRFPIEVTSPNSIYRVDKITRTDPFRPPRSGPSELMIAHVCEVHCIEQVQWVISSLLFEDGRVSMASHNMFAYRFCLVDDDNGRIVHDNDDDGERGSGNRLSSLLEMSNAMNVLVMVSRWFGGVHLGSSRFKWIATVARDGLERGGFIKGR